jgi:hypothetical protein
MCAVLSAEMVHVIKHLHGGGLFHPSNNAIPPSFTG